MNLLLVFCVALSATILNLVLTPSIIRISHRFRWYDRLDHRKIHTVLIPRLGGVGIFTSFFVSIIVVPIIFNTVFGAQSYTFLNIRLVWMFSGFLMIYLLGLIDDFYSLKAALKFLIQILAAGVVTAGGFVVKSIWLPGLGTIEFGFFAYPLTIIWIVGITNAMNLVDGMDGLSAGIASFAALTMGVIALLGGGGQVATAIMAFALLGALAGFLRYNFPPAKIFMGDSGSLFLGFALAVFPLMGLTQKGISAAGTFGSLLIPITVLLVPIIDTLAAIFRRIRRKQSIAAPDKEHIHHKLLDLGLSEKKILAVVYSVCLYLSIVSVTLTSDILPNKALHVLIVFVVWIGLVMGYGILHLVQSKKKEAHEKHDDKENTRIG
ncbi:MAG: undecaprenyl/decaprenyl-phosphate alpha-N-acetylglucosaminyl 1-phosphate transferase [Spirochaetales bacterium]|nr:undecaprenyl/decaprenyl-phosphate alpha-N-acetylglucosaminyl 1-phosphate transferase [Spirochaetales bacterium]